MESTSAFDGRSFHGGADLGDQEIRVVKVAERILELLEPFDQGRHFGDGLADRLHQVSQSLGTDSGRMRLRVVLRSANLSELSDQRSDLLQHQRTDYSLERITSSGRVQIDSEGREILTEGFPDSRKLCRHAFETLRVWFRVFLVKPFHQPSEPFVLAFVPLVGLCVEPG